MGLDYSYRLFFEHSEFRSVLTELDSMQALETNNFTLILHDGLKFELPCFLLNEQPKEYDLREPHSYMPPAGLSLWFTDDKHIVVYDKPHRQPTGNSEEKRTRIGYIYLRINANHRSGLTEFEFTAATTSMSLLFEQSTSIKRHFLALIEAHDGVCALFNDEDKTDHTGHLIWPTGYEKEAGLVKRDELLNSYS